MIRPVVPHALDEPRNGRIPCEDGGPQAILDLLEQIVRLGANVEAADGMGKTPLIYASILGEPKSVEMLAQHADLEVTDYEGQTALIFAAQGGNEKAALALLQRGASPDVQDKNCNSLWEAAELEGHASLGRAIVAEVEKLGRTVRRA